MLLAREEAAKCKAAKEVIKALASKVSSFICVSLQILFYIQMLKILGVRFYSLLSPFL